MALLSIIRNNQITPDILGKIFLPENIWDVYTENGSKYTFDTYLPGFDREEVNMYITDGIISIRAKENELYSNMALDRKTIAKPKTSGKDIRSTMNKGLLSFSIVKKQYSKSG